MPSEDAKPVKKEELVKKEQGGEGKEEEKSLSAILQAGKKNPTNAGSLATKTGSKVTKFKKEVPQDDDFHEPIKGKGKGSSGSSSKPVAKVKEEEYNSDDDDDDHKPIFKKTQLMESGLLSMEVAKKVYEKKQKKNKFTSPVKAASVTKKTQSATVTKKTPSSAESSTKTKTTVSKVLSSTKTKAIDSKVASRHPKKRKAGDESSEDDPDDDFLITRKNTEKQKTS